MTHFGPPDASRAPRYTGIRTFARCPNVGATEGFDAAVVGIPFDTATTNRPGARFGPAAIRDASRSLRPYNPVLDVDVFKTLSVVDRGDVETTPGNAERTVGQIADAFTPLAQAGVVTIGLGGDHTVTLGELRAHAAAHGPLGLVLLDAHADTWDQYFGERYFHGTPFRRAVEEGVVDPQRSVMAGMRGPLYGPEDITEARELGYTVLPADELEAVSAIEFAALVESRTAGGPAFLSFDIDFVDPAFAPGTGTPEVGGPSTREALAALRALAGQRFCGFDVVEVSPPYDSAGQTTAYLAANVAYECLSLAALAKSP